MRWVLGLLALLLAAAQMGLAADLLRAEGTAGGDAVLGFLGQDVSAEIDADLQTSGVLCLNSGEVRFTAAGPARGSGTGNLETLVVDAWIAFDATGETEDGTALRLRGGLLIDRVDAATTSTGGKGGGRFYLIVSLGDASWTCEGEAEASASGAFVVPDDPYTMQLRGTGTFALSGELRPLDEPNHPLTLGWPDGLWSQLDALLAPPAATADPTP
ncbi:MAG: hypothetical protein AB1778_08525 [Candidatus Bipolaricaulota bacterium]